MCLKADITLPTTTDATFCKNGSGVSTTSTVLAVSVWAGDATATDIAANTDLILTFQLSAWKDHSADWAAPAAPSPAAADATVFGAKALAVSAAAAAAVAAALY